MHPNYFICCTPFNIHVTFSYTITTEQCARRGLGNVVNSQEHDTSTRRGKWVFLMVKLIEGSISK